MKTLQHSQRPREGRVRRYEIRTEDKANEPVILSNEQDLLAWVLQTVGPGAMRDFVVRHLAEEPLTTQQAADMLGMSRPSLIKLLEQGALPYSMVGNRRYVAQAHVEAYRHRHGAALSEVASLPSAQLIDDQLRVLQQQAEEEGDFA